MKTPRRNGSAKALSRLLLLLGIVLLGAGLIFRPGFFATHFSRDGVLEPVTSFCIVVFDIGLAAIGVLGLVTGIGLMRHPEVWRQRMARFIQVPPAPDGRGKRSVFAVSLRICGMHFCLVSLAVVAAVIALKVYWSFSVPHPAISHDAIQYDTLAKRLVEGQGYVIGKWTIWGPVWPTVLAMTYAAGNGSLAVSYLAQTLFGCAVVLMIYGLGRYFFGEATGVLAAVLLGTFPTMVWIEGVLLTEPVYILLQVGFILLAIKASLDGRRLSAAFCGIVFGLLLLCRGVLLYFWPFLWASFLLTGRSRSLKSRVVRLLIATGCAVVVVFPWSFSLSRACGRFVPISIAPYHALWSASRGFVWRGGADERVAAFLEGKENEYRRMNWLQKGDLYKKDAIEEIKKNPKPYLLLVASSPLRMFKDPMYHALVDNVHPERARPLITYYAVIDKTVRLLLGLNRRAKSPGEALAAYHWLYQTYFRGIVIASLLGFLLSLRRWRDLLIVYGLVAYTILFQSAVCLPKPRYVLPIVPFLFLFASVAVTHAAPYLHSRLAPIDREREAGVNDDNSSV